MNRLEMPDAFARRCVVCDELALAAAREHQVAGRGQRAAVAAAFWIDKAPARFARDRIPTEHRADVRITKVHSATRFTDNARKATSYRQGRVLLAGDAAHVHSPFGGQGLNLGIGDAVNLGWKLAATLRGTAPEGLLDTYTDERHPVAAAILDWSRAQVATMKPGPNSPALRKLVLDLMSTPDWVTHVYRQTSGLFHRYDLGSAHPLVGRSAPDFRFTDGTRLGELLRQGQGVLLDFSRDRALQTAVENWADRIHYAAGPVHHDLGFTALLIRPDGIVAWADDHVDPEAFEQAATRWLGHPQN